VQNRAQPDGGSYGQTRQDANVPTAVLEAPHDAAHQHHLDGSHDSTVRRRSSTRRGRDRRRRSSARSGGPPGSTGRSRCGLGRADRCGPALVGRGAWSRRGQPHRPSPGLRGRLRGRRRIRGGRRLRRPPGIPQQPARAARRPGHQLGEPAGTDWGTWYQPVQASPVSGPRQQPAGTSRRSGHELGEPAGATRRPGRKSRPTLASTRLVSAVTVRPGALGRGTSAPR
jgi:hypothetical protein